MNQKYITFASGNKTGLSSFFCDKFVSSKSSRIICALLVTAGVSSNFSDPVKELELYLVPELDGELEIYDDLELDVELEL